MLQQSKLINEELPIKYRVIVDGKMLAERASPALANSFIATLTEEMQCKAQVVPTTSDGKTILLG